MFYDWLDDNRPWANHANMYEAMEKTVDYAAFAFRNDRHPTQEQVQALEKHLLRFTKALEIHPKNYDGPCMCRECLSNG